MASGVPVMSERWRATVAAEGMMSGVLPALTREAYVVVAACTAVDIARALPSSNNKKLEIARRPNRQNIGAGQVWNFCSAKLGRKLGPKGSIKGRARLGHHATSRAD
jgi:hypothetical protein